MPQSAKITYGMKNIHKFLPDRRSLCRIYKEPLQLNNKKDKQPGSEMSGGLTQIFRQREETHGQREELLNTDTCEENANQSHHEMLLHTISMVTIKGEDHKTTSEK
jgi:dTDP-4-amino-4,6-dideoxygalactose transaminase